MKENFENFEVQVNGPFSYRGGSKPEYPEKTPDNQPENWYHILEVKIHRPNLESNPRPLAQCRYWRL